MTQAGKELFWQVDRQVDLHICVSIWKSRFLLQWGSLLLCICIVCFKTLAYNFRMVLMILKLCSIKQPAIYCAKHEAIRIVVVKCFILSLVMRKPAFCICETKTQISFAVTAKLISAFVFATRIVQSLYFLNLKFQASSYPLWLHSAVCVGPGRKPRRPVFSQRSSFVKQHLSCPCGSSVGSLSALYASGPEIDPCIWHILLW